MVSDSIIVSTSKIAEINNNIDFDYIIHYFDRFFVHK